MLVPRYSVSLDDGKSWLEGSIDEIAARAFYTREGISSCINRLRGTKFLRTLEPYTTCQYLQLTPNGEWLKAEIVMCSRNYMTYSHRTTVKHVAHRNQLELIGRSVHKKLLPEIRVRYRGLTTDSFITYRDACRDKQGFALVNALLGIDNKMFTYAEYTGNLVGMEKIYRRGNNWYTDWGMMLHTDCAPRSVSKVAEQSKTASVCVDGSTGKVIAWL